MTTCNSSKRDFKSVISNMVFLSNDVVEITFKITEEDRMCFTPGQFILVKISNSPMIMRAYSVLKYNLDTNEISIAVKRVKGGQGTSIIFNDFKVGMDIDLMGPMGNDLIVDKNNDDILLVATGIGITPIMCILEDLISSNYSGEITFLYGARTSSELFYNEDIDKLTSSNNNIKFIPVLSRENAEGAYKGYVTDVIKDIDLNNKHIYMCCSRSVATSFKEALTNKNFDLVNFHCESA